MLQIKIEVRKVFLKLHLQTVIIMRIEKQIQMFLELLFLKMNLRFGFGIGLALLVEQAQLMVVIMEL